MADVQSEAVQLLKEGKSPSQVQLILTSKGYASEDVAQAISVANRSSVDLRSAEERRNATLLGLREVFDRVGYGAATPQFVNILFWLSQQSSPYIIPLIGILNGAKTVVSVVWSSIVQAYCRLQRVSRSTIAAGGIVYGFSFLFMSFGLFFRNPWLFCASFLIGVLGVVAYGDLYQAFVRDTVRRERISRFLQRMAHWGVLITAASLLLSGYILDLFPMHGAPLSLLGGKSVAGYLITFEITAFAFIIAGYLSSLIVDRREERAYSFWLFLREHFTLMRGKVHVFHDRYVMLLTLASIVNGFLQIVITSYAGIAIYRYLTEGLHSTYPFLTIAAMYSIAILASFTGPFFTNKMHRLTGLAPTLVFGSLLTAILPIVLVYNQHWLTITLALCTYVIGEAIIGFGQGMLTQQLLEEETRRHYFQAQAYVVLGPYLLLIPLLGLGAHLMPIGALFTIVAIGLVAFVMPIYFVLVLVSQKQRL